MDFFIHSTKACDSAKLQKLQKDYKLAGLGFYWKVVELLMLCPIKVHFNSILTLREPPISFNIVKAIINDYDLFDVDENNYVTLKIDKGNGIGEKSLESYLSFFSSSSRASDASHESRKSSRASSDTCTDASSGACTPSRSSFKENKDNKIYNLSVINNKIESKADEGTQNDVSRITEALCKNRPDIANELLIESFLKKNCPHLSEMEQPLTMTEYGWLKKYYTDTQIQDVLLDMENDTNVFRTKRSAYHTALSWLRKRHGDQSHSARYESNNYIPY
ncbi:MAG: DUF4373 domain-containing protein [Bacteroidales bacterium]|nr:DUF4373 domain-containing protein [Bacteroidales bacterium]